MAVRHRALVIAAIAAVAARGFAAPVGSAEVDTEPGVRSTPAVLAPQSGAAPTAASEPTGRASPGSARTGDAALDEASAGAPAMLPRRSASALLLEEHPRVEMVEVVESIVRATAAAVPWLHLGARPRSDAARRRDPAQADAQTDGANRLESERAAGDAPIAAPDGDGANALGRLDVVQEALNLAGDFIANPLTWIVGLPLLCIGFLLAVLRGRRK